MAYATATSDAARQHREELDARVEEVKRVIKVGALEGLAKRAVGVRLNEHPPASQT